MAQRYDVILQVQIEIRNFAEKREKKLEKNTTHHSQQYTLLFYQQSYQPRTCPLKRKINYWIESILLPMNLV